jgi:hypothetical protein
LSWSDIAWADVQSQAMTNRKPLAIYGKNGKVLLKLPSNLNPFEELAATIKARLTDQPSPHANAVRWRKARRTATALLVGTVMALADRYGYVVGVRPAPNRTTDADSRHRR